MFGLNWLKPILRKRMRPISKEKAKKAVRNLSMMYAFLGWNFVSIGLYLTWQEKIPDGPDKIKKYAQILGTDQAHVIKYSGFQKVDEYEYFSDKAKADRESNLTDLDSKPTQELESENITQDSSISIY